jgi:hypothetical protein
LKVDHQVVYDELYYSFLLLGVTLLVGTELARRVLLKDVV